MTSPLTYAQEARFEDDVVAMLRRHGWDEVLDRPTERQLIDNWATILYNNNRDQDRLGDVPLTSSEMDQIIEQITELRTPLRLNEFINGRSVAITRDAPDAHNLGKEVSLKIYDRREIAGGESYYQIARQPKFSTAAHKLLPERRGDLMLLINGMPVIHLELKRSGVPVSQSTNQIIKYAHEGVYTGLFSLVQIFVAMTPTESFYFANPGPEGKFNPDFFFHWADSNNEPINDWPTVVTSLLSIPMAHQLIGFYTVTDREAGVLMAMRSYQYFAAHRIADRVASHEWGTDNKGGYIWHTTGSGKTITSFKTAQLIADSKNADKVVFLLDRVELGTQSLANYRSYGGDAIDVADTSSADELLQLLSNDTSVLIVTSLQKFHHLQAETLRATDVQKLREKRIVFIVDEAHRSTFGDMLLNIKTTLPDALLFGFTGTPIHDENQKLHATTATIFGNELHRYSIADGIRDGNVLGFDPEMVETFRAQDVRKSVALQQAKAIDEQEAYSDPKKEEVFLKFMDKAQVPMAGVRHEDGSYDKGIEDYLPVLQYDQQDHREAVAADISEHWRHLSRTSTFHAILATHSIPEAIEYFRIFRDTYPQLNVTALFDPNIDNTGERQLAKEDGLIEVLEHYNAKFDQYFTMPNHAAFKRDIAARLAHKAPYNTPAFTRDKQIDLLIVVDQMLTGFDSKWLNTLYLDKVIAYENIIQAFSRTNRVFGPEKPFGSIRYYRKPHTMRRNIDAAVKLYSGDKPFGMFVEHLDEHLLQLNQCFTVIKRLFAGIDDFSRLPDEEDARLEFAKVLPELYEHLQAAQIQGFTWGQDTYEFVSSTVTVELTEPVFIALLSRYKELDRVGPDPEPGSVDSAPPYDINVHITHIDTARIDADYLNAKYAKYLRAIKAGVPQAELDELLSDLHTGFARLSAEDQVFANRWLHDIQSGDAVLAPGKTVQDYIIDYKLTQQALEIDQLVQALDVDADLLRTILGAHVDEANINEYGRFDDVVNSVNLGAATAYFQQRAGKKLPPFKVRTAIDRLLRQYVLHHDLPADLEEGAAEGGEA
ncbi:type I restriction endonuclease subunit R, EcoR124 family [Gulosibacter bifidus]|uniref:Type I restriction enzyme endonuclease subunit n=1 Tax=Gulosibacter bifidus TaxID=272239 RepID=A0ABW5RJW0_9MICO|nr:HsdR family type I site-specific deoxyribonuclease [Gulosibacter bifidus]